MITLFARLHNILDDNGNREINGEHMNLWPTIVTKYVINGEILNFEGDKIHIRT